MEVGVIGVGLGDGGVLTTTGEGAGFGVTGVFDGVIDVGCFVVVSCD